MDDFKSQFVHLLVALFIPPLGVYLVAGCTADVWLSVCLLFTGIPATIHAVYLVYVYHKHRELAKRGQLPVEDAPLVFSKKVQTGGYSRIPIEGTELLGASGGGNTKLAFVPDEHPVAAAQQGGVLVAHVPDEHPVAAPASVAAQEGVIVVK